MKQLLLSTLAIFTVALFTCCEQTNNTPTPTPKPDPNNKEFKFENIEVSHSEISVDIRPVDKDMEYVICLSQPRYFEQNGIDTREELLADDYEYFSSLAQSYNMSIYDFLTNIGWLVKGDKDDYRAINLYPDTEYVVYCYGVEFEGDSIEAITPVNHKVIKTTAPAMIDVSFDVKCNVENNSVTIDIDPNDYKGYYYTYIVAEGESLYIYDMESFTDQKLEHYRNYTYNEFNKYINDLGAPTDHFCHKGKVTLEETLKPYTNYHIAVFAVSNDRMPILCSVPAVHYFTTAGVPQSDLTIELSVTDITPYTAQLTITPSNNTEEYACVFLKREQVPNFEDDAETMKMIILNYQPAIFTGAWSEQLMPLMPNSEYSILAFGINSDQPTTKLFRHDFTSAEATEGNIKVESIDIVKLFDAEAIVALDSSYADALAECSCVAVVEMKTSKPTNAVYFWWYEMWAKDEYSDEAFLEDLLLYDPTDTTVLMDMYYSLDIADKFFFAGIAEDEEGNLSPIYYGEPFTLSQEQCDPAEEFFQYAKLQPANTFIVAR